MLVVFPFARAFLAVALSAVIGASAAQAAETWVTTCNEDNRCTARLTVRDVQNGRIFGSVGIQVGKGGAEPGLIVFAPLGVALKPGLRAVINGQTFEVPFEVCYPDGCRAVAKITPAELEVWLSAETAALQFFPFEFDKPVAADLPLTGLREALKETLSAVP